MNIIYIILGLLVLSLSLLLLSDKFWEKYLILDNISINENTLVITFIFLIIILISSLLIIKGFGVI